jgi:16S rRNA (guanine966-N2)-methyltransferase
MRIIAGSLKGRTIHAPRGLTVRPTSDKVREALFDILQNRIAGASLLDLFAGVGAVGIEALSRGAAWVTFVEKSRMHCKFLERNLNEHRLSDRSSIYNMDAMTFLAHPPCGPARYDLIFLDPPYRSELLRKALPMIASSDIITTEPLIIVEHHHKQMIEEKAGDLKLLRQRRYGETVLSFLTKAV